MTVKSNSRLNLKKNLIVACMIENKINYRYELENCQRFCLKSLQRNRYGAKRQTYPS